MIDGSSVSLDWQRHTGDICVLPIGSFEQHSYHLPVETDNITAEFFGRMLAEDLDAALLPTLPLGTCLEHSGFRGSISLRPETLMQIIRDIAEEVERQHFKILVIVNGHGGNFSLAPVIRDINRLDRSLKVLLVGTMEFVSPDIANDSRDMGLDIHAGEGETSVMLALRPELVRSDSMDRDAGVGEELPLRQSDLNTFGMGYFSSAGVVGYPSLASAEKGRAMIASARKGMLDHVQDRVRRLREQWRYSGAGGIAIRPMILSDIPDGMRLKTLAGWNQTEEDWNLFLKSHPTGCFVAVHNGRVIGTTAAIQYEDDAAWIGLVLVDPSFRRMGIGTMLLERAIRSLEGCRALRLDATPTGQELYRNLGFVEEYRLQRLVHSCLPLLSNTRLPSESVSPSIGIIPIIEDTMESVIKLDRQVSGADRHLLLNALWERTPGSAYARVDEGYVQGFCLGRPGTLFHEVGPVIAESLDHAIALASSALEGLVGRAVVLDVPDHQAGFREWLLRLGFTSQRPLIRMVRGRPPIKELPEKLYAIAGPEFG